MATTAKTIRIANRAKISLSRSVDATTRELTRAWARAWSEINAEFQDAIDDLIKRSNEGLPPRHVVNRAAKAQAALQHAAEQLDLLGQQAGVTIKGRMVDLVKGAQHWTEVMALSQMPKGSWAALNVSWSQPSDRAIDAIVQRSAGQVESLLRPLSRGAAEEMKRALVRGVASGQNPRVAAKRMIANTKGAFDGGLPRAQNIARTEMIDAARRGADESRRVNDTIKGWMWYSTLDVRTCGSCLAMAGTEHPKNEPGPHDHQQGRCVAIPITFSWKELGFDIDEPPAVARQDGKGWFDKQPKDVQREIVGPSRLKALDDGKIEFSDLAVRKENPGWRDSYSMPSVASL